MASSFASYAVTVATTKAGLGPGKEHVVFTASKNPELGVYELPGDDGTDAVTTTITDELEPSTLYYAQLSATDSCGRAFLSNTAEASTTVSATNGVIDIYDSANTQPMGTFCQPSSTLFAPSSKDPPPGDPSCYTYVPGMDPSCPKTGPCWENLGCGGMSYPTTGITTGAFGTTAYLEFQLAIDPPTNSYYSTVYLLLGGGGADAGTPSFGVEDWVARRDGKYRLMQFPLRALRGGDGPLTYGDLVVTPNIYKFFVGAKLLAPANVVRIGGIRILW
jgi:hypothetical protein